jgi:predicted nucleic acid-binding protein
VSVFVDTSALYAMLVSNDYMNVRARALMEHLVRERRTLHTSSYVLVETTALLHVRAGHAAARDFERHVRPALEVRWVDAALHARAARRYAEPAARAVSLVDAVSFAVMRELHLEVAFTYDADFALEGFRVVGHVEELRG